MLVVPEVKKLLKQGLYDGEIGDKLGYSKYQIHRFRKANNIPSCHEFKMQNTIRQIKELDGKCVNQEDLAHRIGLSQNRVSEILSKYQLEISYKNRGKCIICGKLLEGWGKYCSDECRNTKEFKCEICGKKYQSTKNNKVCGDENCIKQRNILLKHKKKEYDRKRKGMKYNSIGHFTEEEFRNISLDFFNWECAYTGEKILDDLSNCHREHVVPLSKGGDNGIWNVVPALDWVNLSKNNNNMEVWYRKQPYFSEERLEKIYEYIDLVSELYRTKPNTVKVEDRVSLDKDLIKDLINKGYTDVEIAKQLNYSPTGIMTFRKKNNIYSSREFKDKELIKQINKLNGKVKTQKELAEKLGITTKVLTRILKNYNIEFIKKKVNFRKFGTWTIIKKINPEEFECRCDCGVIRVFNLNQINRGLTHCRNCGKKLSETKRKRMFLADYKRAEKIKQKDLNKRGKTYIINSVKKIDELGRDTYVNLCCAKGHMTKNNFNNYDGCKVCN